MKKVNLQDVKKAQMILRAINHKSRQQILDLIESRIQINVTQIYHQLDLEQSVASQQLAILRKANIVKTKREGKIIWYSINFATLERITKYTNKLINN